MTVLPFILFSFAFVHFPFKSLAQCGLPCGQPSIPPQPCPVPPPPPPFYPPKPPLCPPPLPSPSFYPKSPPCPPPTPFYPKPPSCPPPFPPPPMPPQRPCSPPPYQTVPPTPVYPPPTPYMTKPIVMPSSYQTQPQYPYYGHGYGQNPSSYTTGYGYGYGRQPLTSPFFTGGTNPIPASEKHVHNSPTDNSDEAKTTTTNEHEAVKDPFEKEEGHQKNVQRDQPNFLPSGYAVGLPMGGMYRPNSPPIVQLPEQMPQMPYYPPPHQQPCSLPMPPQPPPCPLQPPQFPPPPPMMPPPPSMPLPPFQNCCLRCGRPICKTFAAAKMLGTKTVNGFNWLKGEKQAATKIINDQCNDRSLAQIMQQVAQLDMAKAKEAIVMQAEDNSQKQTLVHVFCAPNGLEYALRAESFCAGQVSDGVCFAFRTARG